MTGASLVLEPKPRVAFPRRIRSLGHGDIANDCPLASSLESRHRKEHGCSLPCAAPVGCSFCMEKKGGKGGAHASSLQPMAFMGFREREKKVGEDGLLCSNMHVGGTALHPIVKAAGASPVYEEITSTPKAEDLLTARVRRRRCPATSRRDVAKAAQVA